jgi:hypothetical protein
VNDDATLDPPAQPSLGARVLDALSSLGLSCCLLIFLLYLTWRGTLTQVELGLKEAQARYFDSLIVHEEFFGVPILLPGAYLVLAALTVNLILGGVVRIRKSKRTVGILIAHLGILMIVAAGFVKFHYSDEGYVDLAEGQSTSEFTSFYDWELAITEVANDAPTVSEWVIPQSDFLSLRAQDRAIFKSPDLPFDLELAHFARNTAPRMLDDSRFEGPTVVDGFQLQAIPLETDAEANAAGAIATLKPKDGGPEQRAILFGFNRFPHTARFGDRAFLVDLRHVKKPMPFAIRLEKFYKTTHPGVDIPRDFSSDVTRIEDGAEHGVKIKMNEPMRSGDFIVFQTKYRDEMTAFGIRTRSILAVVRNPSDQWPLWSCVVIAIGLVIHFGAMLVRFARSQARQEASS